MADLQAARRRQPHFYELLLAFAAIYLIWGSTFLAIRFAVQTLPPLLLMGARHLTAGLLLFGWLWLRGFERPERRLWLHALISSAFCFLGCHGLLAWAELYVPSGLAALLSGSLPIWMVLLARAGGQESELNPRVLSGIVLGFIGLAVLLPLGLRGERRELLGSLAIVLCELLWAVGAIYARGIRTRTPPTTFAAMQMVCGGVLLGIGGLGIGETSHLNAAAFTARSVLSLVFLIVFGSLLAFTAYTWLLQVSSPAIVSTHSYVNPVVAVLLGWALAGEQVTMRTIAGTAIILASVALIRARPKGRAAERAKEEQAA
jgi:drug/metabolite transporter (DMT)-like permease